MSKSTLKPTDEESASMWKKRTASESAFSMSMRLAYRVMMRLGGGLGVVGEQDGGLVVAEIGDEELAEGALVRTRLLFVDARGAMLAAGYVEGDGAPSRWRQVVDLGEQAWRASPQGDEGDPGRIEPIEAVVGGELGVEDEVLRQAAMLALPERDEAKDLLGLLALADVGVRIAEHLAVGVLGQEGEDAGLAAAALGQIVGFDQRVLAEVGHGVEVEVEGLAGQEGLSGHLVVPKSEQAGDLLRGDARGIFRQEALLGHGVEPAEQREPFVGHERHDVALAFDRP